MNSKASSLFIVCLSFALTGNSAPHALITDPGPGLEGYSSGNNTLGFDFIVGPSPVLVSDLRIFDMGAPGLLNSHQVGLWDANGNLLVSVVVPAGTSAPVSNQFRFGHLASPVMLSPGTKYVLGAGYVDFDGDHEIFNFFNGNQATFDPAVTGNDVRYFEGAGFTFPASDGASGSEIGPNAIFTVVPEPATPALLVSLAASVVFFRKAGS